MDSYAAIGLGRSMYDTLERRKQEGKRESSAQMNVLSRWQKLAKHICR